MSTMFAAPQVVVAPLLATILRKVQKFPSLAQGHLHLGPHSRRRLGAGSAQAVTSCSATGATHTLSSRSPLGFDSSCPGSLEPIKPQLQFQSWAAQGSACNPLPPGLGEVCAGRVSAPLPSGRTRPACLRILSKPL